MRKLIISALTVFISFACFAQTDYKRVYDKSLEQQIKSSFGLPDSYWDFYPGWYYSFLHSKYKSGEYENNNVIPLDSLNEAANTSLYEVTLANEAIEVVYQNEKAHWEDRNSDREIAEVLQDIENCKRTIQKLTEKFAEYKVPVYDAQNVYDEYDRINRKTFLIGESHLDNSKKRRAYSLCINEFVALINVCYRINYYCITASKNDEFNQLITGK